jgi:hypothetical protein
VKAIGQSKLTKRLVLLFALTGALVYLRQPDKASAYYCGNACAQYCLDAEVICTKGCSGNKTCINGCVTQFKLCLIPCGPCEG